MGIVIRFRTIEGEAVGIEHDRGAGSSMRSARVGGMSADVTSNCVWAARGLQQPPALLAAGGGLQW